MLRRNLEHSWGLYRYYNVFYGNKKVGYFSLRWESKTELSVWDVRIYDEFQGMGFGKKLIRDALNLCRFRKILTVWLNTGVNNLRAQHVYELFGFRRFKKYGGMIYMRVDLSRA